MQPLDLQAIGEELALKWADGTESFIKLETLRRGCPCAGCQGERDVLGQLHKPPTKPLVAASFRLVRLDRVGSYAVQPVWQDGHATGIYSYDYLKQLGDASSSG